MPPNPAHSVPPFSRIDWIDPAHPLRAEVEHFVRLVYRARFGARLAALMPRLLAFRDDAGALAAVVGLRCASEGPLFVERYLALPVEQRLERLHGDAVARAAVVEFGNFAARTPGSARAVITTLLPLLQDAGLRWVLFVATRQLRNTFARLGLAPVRLQAAEPRRLGDEAMLWGRYYDTRPDVVVGDLRSVAADRRERPPLRWQPCALAS